MNQNGIVEGYIKAIWSGATTLQFARAVEWAIRKAVTGLYRVTNNRSISKYELLKLFQKYTGKKIKIIPVSGKSSDKSFKDTRGLLDYSIPTHEDIVSEMVELIADKKELYSQYGVI